MITDQAFVLHTLAYQNSSQIVRLLCRQHGRIDAIAKGSRGSKSPFKGHLQPFIETAICCQGKRDLKTLTRAEQSVVIGSLNYLNQVAMLYCNELLLLLNMDEEMAIRVYPVYRDLLTALAKNQSVALLLRYFELKLCELSGYALSVDPDMADEAILVFQPDQGLVGSHGHQNCDADTFRRFSRYETITDEELRGLNRLFRSVVHHLVGGRRIRSRELLRR